MKAGRLAAAAAVAVAAAGAAVGVATAAGAGNPPGNLPGSPAGNPAGHNAGTRSAAQAAVTATNPTAPTKRSDVNRRGPLSRAVWAQVEVRTRKGFVTFDYQRGTVRSVQGATITVASADGRTVRYVTNSTTRVHRLGKPATVSQVVAGDWVMVISTGDPLTARAIRDPGPPKSSSTST